MPKMPPLEQLIKIERVKGLLRVGSDPAGTVRTKKPHGIALQRGIIRGSECQFWLESRENFRMGLEFFQDARRSAPPHLSHTVVE
jgi:hypothetical protein